VHRKWKEKQFDYVLVNMVHPYYKFEFVKDTFRNNVFPVSLDTIEYNGVIKPPTSIQRQPGQKRTKRIRKILHGHARDVENEVTTGELAKVR
jgi:hypothetical protein